MWYYLSRTLYKKGAYKHLCRAVMHYLNGERLV